MTKLRIEKGASRVRRVPLKTTIDGTVADEIELMCKWSENDTSYVVNQLLRFALNQSEEFQQQKQTVGAASLKPAKRPQADGTPAASPAARTTEAGQ